MASGSSEPVGDISSDILVPKKKGTSAVWEYFGFCKNDTEELQVLSRTCLANVATSHGNTTNLFQHLKHHHKVLFYRCIANLPENYLTTLILLGQLQDS